MCIDLSGIILKPINGDRPRIIRGTDTNSHEKIIALHGLREGVSRAAFARYEYSPKDGNWSDCKLTIDEARVPDWLDDEVREYLEEDCKRWVESITIAEDRPTVLGGTWIIKGDVKIKYADRCRLLVGVGARLDLGDIDGVVSFGDIRGLVKTGDVHYGGGVKTGGVYGGGSVKTGDVRDGGCVTTGVVCDGGSVKTGVVRYGAIVATGGVYDGGVVKTGGVYGGIVRTGCVCPGGSVRTGDVDKGGSVRTGHVAKGGIVRTRCVCIGGSSQRLD